MVAADADHRRVRASVSGRVQGVGYRYFVLNRARALGVRGWVRNEDDGSVSIVADGPAQEVCSLLEFITRGPRSARVDRVATEEVEISESLPEFEVRYL